VRVAIFDIDGTLVGGSSERMFWRYLVRHGKQGPRQVLAYLLFLLRYLPTGGVHTLKKNKAYLAGLSVQEVEQLAARFVAERLGAELYEPVVARVREHLNRGDLVVLMSGTLECIARALAARLGVQQVCATLCSQRAGRFLAQPPEIHPFAAAKLSLAKQIATAIGTDFSRLVAYADSAQDLFLLAAVGEAVAVRPDATLQRVAQDLGWEIIGERAAERKLAS
jgi:HAD superfamily hydrolase (TIGR01490 family)